MIHWSEGLFGFIASLQPIVDALVPLASYVMAVRDRNPSQTIPTFPRLSIPTFRYLYRRGTEPVKLTAMLLVLYKKIEGCKEVDPTIWLHLEPKAAVMERARKLEAKWPDKTKTPFLFGVPFSVKDSIDVAGIPTTTACPPLTRVPSKSSPVVERLLQQGALFIGKTNLDQLATGLTGCRSPYGIPRSVYDNDYICGGSSSGSCASVGAGLVAFSVATDSK